MRLIRGSSLWELILGAKRYSANSAWMWRRRLKLCPAVRCLGPYLQIWLVCLHFAMQKSSFPRATILLPPSLRFRRLATTGPSLVPEHGPLSGLFLTLLVLLVTLPPWGS